MPQSDVLISIGLDPSEALKGRDAFTSALRDIEAAYARYGQQSKDMASQTATAMASTAQSTRQVKSAVDEYSAAYDRAAAAVMSGEARKSQAAQKAAADQARALKSLESSILPLQAAQQRLTEQTLAWDRAMLTGAISMDKWKQGAAALTAQKAMLTQETARTVSGFGNMRFALANAGQQFQDMIIVSQMGGAAFGQMGIQVAQLVSGFGRFGPGIGIAVTALGFLAGSLANSSGETQKAEEATKRYGKALDAVIPIIDRYYEAQDRANNRPSTSRAEQKAIDDLKAEIADLEGQYAKLQKTKKDSFGLILPGPDAFHEVEIKLLNARAALFQAQTTPKQTADTNVGTAINEMSQAREREISLVRLSTSGHEREAAMLKAEYDVRSKLKELKDDDPRLKSSVASARANAASIFDMEAAHKAAEKAANDNQRAQEKLAREAEQSKQRYDASITSARDYVQSLDDQRAALSMSERDAEVFRAGLKVEHDLRKANGGALTEEARGYVELAKARAGALYDDKQKKKQEDGTDLKQKYLPQSIREDMEIKYLQAHKDRLIELGWTEEELTRLIQEHNIKRLEASQNWADGAEAALRRYSMSASNYGAMAGRVVTNGMQSMENALVGFSSKTMTAAQAFKSMATSIIQDLIRMQVQAQITGPLSGMLSSGLSSLFGSSNAYMSGSNSMGSIDTSGISVADAGTSFSAPMAFASGTDYAPGGLSLVGEEGPELMQLPGGARIYPADETQAILSPRAANSNNSSGAVTHIAEGAIVVNAPGASAEDAQAIALAVAQQVVAAAAPQIQRGAVQQSLGAVQSAANRGGSFAQAVGRR